MKIQEIKELMEKVRTIKVNMPFGYGNDESAIIKTCEKLEVMGFEWGDSIRFRDFRIEQEYYISPSNKAKNYKPQKGEWFVIWDNGNIGRLQFVRNKDWFIVNDEWENFKQRLLGYEPLDYDIRNDQIVYSIENGKKLLKDYDKICDETMEAMNKKIKRVELERAKKEYEKLLSEVQK